MGIGEQYEFEKTGRIESKSGLVLAAGRPQEPRSDHGPTSPTARATPALRIDLRAGIVDLRSVPPPLLYKWRDGIEGPEVWGEYRRALDMATDNGWGWATNVLLSVIVVSRLTMIGGPA